jgi:hypothetical protein
MPIRFLKVPNSDSLRTSRPTGFKFPVGLSGSVANTTVDYLVVAGGGAGGSGLGGGGGAGGLTIASGQSLSSGANYSISVGAGGTFSGSPFNIEGNPGSWSFINSGPSTIVSTIGGGGGGGENPANRSGLSGGSGGGSNYGWDFWNRNFKSRKQWRCGRRCQSNPVFTSGGGGGASAVGQTGQPTTGGNGGDGTLWVDGFYYGGGGGGSGHQGVHKDPIQEEVMAVPEVEVVGLCKHLVIPGGTGDTTGRNPAQNGGVGSNAAGGAGGENTGGGGGGGTDLNGNGGNAGKGIIIIRYTDTNGQQAGGGTVTAPSGYIVHTFHW